MSETLQPRLKLRDLVNAAGLDADLAVIMTTPFWSPAPVV